MDKYISELTNSFENFPTFLVSVFFPNDVEAYFSEILILLLAEQLQEPESATTFSQSTQKLTKKANCSKTWTKNSKKPLYFFAILYL